MSEVVIAKAGGTSNATAEAVMCVQEWLEEVDGMVVSAPGVLAGEKAPQGGVNGNSKVTDLLLHAYDSEEPKLAVGHIVDRYASIVEGLGVKFRAGRWLNGIPGAIDQSVRLGREQTSLLGERLMADVYGFLGYTVIDMHQGPSNMAGDPEVWRAWLGQRSFAGKKFVVPGNTTRVNGVTTTFDRGGSDITGALVSYARHASMHINLTDGPAKTADPKLVSNVHFVPHLTYAEKRELGRNGTGLVHPAALVPLIKGDIPTQVRSTFDRAGVFTLFDNDHERALQERGGRPVALSLMPGVSLVNVYEPGMAEAVGRLSAFEDGIAAEGVALIDTQGFGVDEHTYVVKEQDSDKATKALRGVVVAGGSVEKTSSMTMLTIVGTELRKSASETIPVLCEVLSSSGLALQGLAVNRHSIRIALPSSADVGAIYASLHQRIFEDIA